MIMQEGGNFCNGNSIAYKTQIRVFNTKYSGIIKIRETDCFRRKYKMKTKKSDKTEPWSTYESLLPSLFMCFHMYFVMYFFFKLCSVREVLFLFYK